MENVYISNLKIEQCSPKKDRIDRIMPKTSIYYIIDGSGYFNGAKLVSGQFFCAMKNTNVCYYPDSKSPWTYIYVDLYGENLSHVLHMYGFTAHNCIGNFDYKDEIIKIEQLYQQHNKKGDYNKDFLCSMANLILSLQNITMINHKDAYTSASRASEIKKYLDQNFYKRITIDELANQFFLSRAYVRNIFFEHFRISPKQYLQQLRMNKAAELLVHTSHNISLVASSVSYSDQFAFSKAFKNFFGISPLKYRERYSTLNK